MSIPEEQFSGPGFILQNLISWTRDGNAWEGRDQAIYGINSRIYGSERIGPFGINKRRLGGGGTSVTADRGHRRVATPMASWTAVARTWAPRALGCRSQPPEASLTRRPAAQVLPSYLAAAARNAAKPSARRAP